MPGKFFDLPKDMTCRHPEHNAPGGLYIPPGKGYEHQCPACGSLQSLMSAPMMLVTAMDWKVAK